MTGPRVDVWVQGVPHPTDGASRVLFWHYLAGLHEAGYDVRAVLLCDPSNATSAEINAFQRDAAYPVAAADAASWTRWHRRVRLRLDTQALLPVRDLVQRQPPDLVVALDIVPAWAAVASGCAPTVTWLGDLAFQTTWHHARYAGRESRSGAIRLPVETARSLAWLPVYRDVLRRSRDNVVSSISSVDKLKRIGVAADYEPYPWPVTPLDADRLSPQLPTFLFQGTLAGLGSRSALHFLIDGLYPKMLGAWGAGGFRVIVAGRGAPPAWAASAFASRPEFDFVGFVADLDPLFAQAHAVIAPIDVPVGNRSRIVTAMGKGTLVIAHDNVALGNPDMRSGVTCLLARTADEFVCHMRTAVERPERAAALAEGARESYLHSFAPSNAVRRLVGRVDRAAAMVAGEATTT